MASPTSPDLSNDGSPKKRRPAFSFPEVHILLDEVRKHRNIVIANFNRGVPRNVRKRTWAEITARINEVCQTDREVSEVVRKWSDLKFDVKRTVRTIRPGPLGPRGTPYKRQRQPPSSQVDRIVRDILGFNGSQPDEGQAGPGPVRRSSRSTSWKGDGQSDSSEEEEEDDEFEEDEDEDMDMAAGVESKHSTSEDGNGNWKGNGTPGISGAKEGPNSVPELLKSFKQEDTEQDSMFDASEDTPFDVSFEMPTEEDGGPQDNQPSSSSSGINTPTTKSATTSNNNAATHTPSLKPPSSSFAIPPLPPPLPSLPLPTVRAPHRAGHSVGTSNGGTGIPRSGNMGGPVPAPASHGTNANAVAVAPDVGGLAAMSVQEQHMSNALLETVSRSLELLSESLQALADTQQEFMRESLQLQSQSLEVLKDFASSAMTLMQEKLNGGNAQKT